MTFALLELKRHCGTKKSQKRVKELGNVWSIKREVKERKSQGNTSREHLKRLAAVGVER